MTRVFSRRRGPICHAILFRVPRSALRVRPTAQALLGFDAQAGADGGDAGADVEGAVDGHGAIGATADAAEEATRRAGPRGGAAAGDAVRQEGHGDRFAGTRGEGAAVDGDLDLVAGRRGAGEGVDRRVDARHADLMAGRVGWPPGAGDRSWRDLPSGVGGSETNLGRLFVY